jgi:hypothetical protein
MVLSLYDMKFPDDELRLRERCSRNSHLRTAAQLGRAAQQAGGLMVADGVLIG